jgi:sphingomyelin phosphodiesterase
LKSCENHNVPVDFEAWKAEILSTKPAVKKNAPIKKPAPFNVLHLTDLHTDLNYAEGSLADCDEPFCCHSESGEYPTDASRAALYWGTYAKCDVPLHTVDALL